MHLPCIVVLSITVNSASWAVISCAYRVLLCNGLSCCCCSDENENRGQLFHVPIVYCYVTASHVVVVVMRRRIVDSYFMCLSCTVM